MSQLSGTFLPASRGSGSAYRRLIAAPAVVVLGLTVAACGSSSKATSSATTSSSTQAGTAVITGGEVKLVSTAQPFADALVVALQGTDVAKARAAYADYDAAWNGIEVYVNVRDKALYEELEVDYQKPVGDGLAAVSPNLTTLLPFAQKLAAAYPKAIANSKTGAPLSPLFDDVTALRIVRADLRRVDSQVKAGDIAGAKARFATFKANYPLVADRVKARSDIADGAIVAAIDALGKEFAEANASAKELTPLITTLTTRFNFAVNLWNAAARNVVLTKTTFAPAEVTAVGSLRTLEAATTKSLTDWKAANYTAATADVTAATAAFTAIAAQLKPLSSDTALNTAITAYAKLVGAGGDAAAVTEAGTKVIEASKVAEQSLVGQFWTDANLKSALAALPKA